jgi:predicted HTH domain antitoxin
MIKMSSQEIQATVPHLIDLEIKYLIQTGFYKDTSEVISDAIRHLLLHHADYRVEIAVAAYVAEEISLCKAAEMMGLCLDDMKEFLQDRGISIKLGPETEAEAIAEVNALEEMLSERGP